MPQWSPKGMPQWAQKRATQSIENSMHFFIPFWDAIWLDFDSQIEPNMSPKSIEKQTMLRLFSWLPFRGPPKGPDPHFCNTFRAKSRCLGSQRKSFRSNFGNIFGVKRVQKGSENQWKSGRNFDAILKHVGKHLGHISDPILGAKMVWNGIKKWSQFWSKKGSQKDAQTEATRDPTNMINFYEK